MFGCSEDSITPTQEPQSIDPNKVYKWNMVTTWPKNYPGLGRAAENLSKYVDIELADIIPGKSLFSNKNGIC